MIPFSILLFLLQNLLVPALQPPTGPPPGQTLPPKGFLLQILSDNSAAITVDAWEADEHFTFYMLANADGATESLPNGVNGEFGEKTLLSGTNLLKTGTLWSESGPLSPQSHNPPFNTGDYLRLRWSAPATKRYQYVMQFTAYYTVNGVRALHSGESGSGVYIY